MAVDRPVCYLCSMEHKDDREVSPVDAVFESLCGHDECPSMVFHGLCLMRYREMEATVEARAWNNSRIERLRRWLHGED